LFLVVEGPIEFLAGGVPAEALAGPVVEFVFGVLELGGGVCAEVGALGRYSRSSPLRFSLLPRCQGACGSAK
jgi:hypothetical protein